ncbi:TetR/AcrR family transcriptional regulator [Agromyces sp. G08B096]|uniref:TetR/AcrR family transcriptional regulator n=1 Tax=Agromyces sp. G08B096 TaxID=3156399 RepID=A0AAU7W5N6_9MICO
MPKPADHDQRRRQITDAARQVVARDGLRAATFRSIATEAGLSVRLVQYYFGSKEDVLRATRAAVAADAAQRMQRAVSELAGDSRPAEVIRAILLELLPIDVARREDTMVLDAFFFAEITSTAAETPSDDAADASGYLQDLVCQQVVLAGADPSTAEADARLIVAAASGLAQAMLADARLVARAPGLIDRLLDRMLVH